MWSRCLHLPTFAYICLHVSVCPTLVHIEAHCKSLPTWHKRIDVESQYHYQEGTSVKHVLTPEGDGYGFEVGTHDKPLAHVDIEKRYQ